MVVDRMLMNVALFMRCRCVFVMRCRLHIVDVMR